MILLHVMLVILTDKDVGCGGDVCNRGGSRYVVC